MDNFREKIQNLKAKVNIVEIISNYLPLVKKGKNYWVVCPFHEDNNPSMAISPEKQIYKCFSCGEQGNVFLFLEKYKKINFNQAVREIASIANINLADFNLTNLKQKESEEKHPFKVINDLAVGFFQYQLTTESAKKAKTYLQQRKIADSIIDDFLIGYAAKNNNLLDYFLSQNYELTTLISAGIAKINNAGKIVTIFTDRIMFPILDIDGSCLGFSGRYYEEKQSKNFKYINTPETEIFKKSKILYNIYHAKAAINNKQNYLYLVEGYLDVIAFYKIGIKNCVALMGTNLTKEHCLMLKKLVDTVVIFLDGDIAGQNATLKMIKILLKFDFNVKIIKNYTNKDPDELVNNHAHLLETVFKNRMHAIDFVIDFLLTKYDIKNDVFQLQLFLSELGTIFQLIKNPITLSFYLNKLITITNFSENQLKEILLVKENKLPVNNLILSQKITKSFSYFEKLLELEKQLLMFVLIDRKVYYFLEEQKFVFFNKEILNLYFLIAQIYANNDKLDNISLETLTNELKENQLLPFLTAIFAKYYVLKSCFNKNILKEYLIKIENCLIEIEIESLKAKMNQMVDINFKVELLKKMSLLKNQKKQIK